MKRKTQILLLVAMLAAVCLLALVGCTTQKADYFTYSEENLGVMGKLVKWMHGWVGNYGWTVVVFTVFLKLITSPLDVWQRVASRKMTIKNQQMQPLLAEIDKRYGANTQRANDEKRKVYGKAGYSMLSSCLPMIISMVIFFVMFAGLRDYSTYSSVTNFQALSDTYYKSYYSAVQQQGGEMWTFLEGEHNDLLENSEETNEYKKQINAYIVGIDRLEKQYGASQCAAFRTAALEEVKEYYENHHESWLWIQNVWQPDTWATLMPAYNDSSNGFGAVVDMSEFGVDNGVSHYEMIRSAVLETGKRGDEGKWNGLMILPILSIGLSFLSMFISQQMDKKTRKGETQQDAQQKATNTTMMIMMPLMMAFFGFMYTGAFAIYMVANYTLSILTTVALRLPIEKIVQKSLAKSSNSDNGKASYMR